MLKLTDSKEQYKIRQAPTWEDRLILRVSQVVKKCNYARFILTVDNGRITLEQIGKPEQLNK